MGYNYETEKTKLLEAENVRTLMTTRDKVLALVKHSGAVSMGKAMSCWGSGNSWTMMAAIDWMVEQGDLREVMQQREPVGQYRIFMLPYGD